jgi:ABC-2 type transport system ATP-binding protein
VSYLRFVAAAKGIPKQDRDEAVERALSRCDLGAVSRRVLANLSKGNRQRVGLAQAVLGEPAVIVLDEPTAGLDPLTVLDVREMLAAYGRDRAVLLSTHTLSEARLLCDRLVVVASGSLVYDGPTAAMLGVERLADSPEEAFRAALLGTARPAPGGEGQ